MFSRAEREEKTDAQWKPSALLLCARQQDARVIRSVLGGMSLSVDQCFESYTAERLIEVQPYLVMLFDLETPGAGELMQNMRRRTGGALQIALASRSAAVDRERLGAELVFRPVNEERMAVELGRAVSSFKSRFTTEGHGEPRSRAAGWLGYCG